MSNQTLSTWFLINMPYCLKRNTQNEWVMLNKQYLPLGWNNPEVSESIEKDSAYANFPVYTAYEDLNNDVIKEIAGDFTLYTDDNGNINQFYLYSSSNMPTNTASSWNDYTKRIKRLSSLKVVFQ